MFHHQRQANKVQCRCWHAAASGQLSRSWAQIWLRHSACPIFPSEPVGMSHNQLPPPQQCREWSYVDPDRRTVEFVQLFQELCNLWVSLCVRHRQQVCDRSWTWYATETPVYDSSFCPQRLVESLWGSRSTFPKIGTKFDAHLLFLSLIHCENHHRSPTQLQINARENCPRPPS